ncbi:hypothetical protein MRB53_021628 [Persea americana]|uniref:Uncharacterized protein n=1 Tax=Persea americana TaxID=3435 RepID=A0ACC2L4I9_PERAE|nr:hypothetical protein MRB53_021628 [Persea americana]
MSSYALPRSATGLLQATAQAALLRASPAHAVTTAAKTPATPRCPRRRGGAQPKENTQIAAYVPSLLILLLLSPVPGQAFGSSCSTVEDFGGQNQGPGIVQYEHSEKERARE